MRRNKPSHGLNGVFCNQKLGSSYLHIHSLVGYSVATNVARCHAWKPVVFQSSHDQSIVFLTGKCSVKCAYFCGNEYFVLADRKHISNDSIDT
jgi:hypothetical protein